LTAQTNVQSKYSTKPEAQRRVDLAGYLFVLPFLVAYVAFFVWPVILGFRMSLTDWSLVGTGTRDFLGLANYAEVLSDSAFWGSLWHTVLFTLLVTPIVVVLALILAILANRAIPARWFFRLSFFAPYVLPSSVVALIWVWLYQPGFGLINGFLTRIGLPDVAWLTDPDTAMISVVITTVWWTIGFAFVLYLAGLQEIPRELYDAAAVDGAGSLAQTRFITLPLLRRIATLIIALTLLSHLQVFDQIYLMTAGGPNYSTRPITQLFYEQGFTSYRIGLASAITYLFFLMILVVSVAQFLLIGRRRREA
jgi:multiple sugar transport system permease protein